MKRISGLLFLVCVLTYSYFYQGGGHNEAARFDTVRAVLQEHRFIVDTFAYNSADLISYEGHYYSSKAPGTFLLALPFYGLFHFILSFFISSPEYLDHWTCYWTTVWSVSILCALAAVLLFRLGQRLGATTAQSCGLVLTLTLGTLYFPFATVFFSHSPTAFFILLGFYQIFKEAPAKRSQVWVAGLSLGFAILLEYPAAIATVLVALYAFRKWWRQPHFWSSSRHLVMAMFAGVFPLFICNYLAFGQLFYVPYQAYATDPNASFAAHKSGLLGIHLAFLEPAFWPQFFSNLAEITYRPLRGIFVANPILILIFPGYWLWYQGREFRQEWLFSVLLTAGYFAFNASYGDSLVYWGGGASFGPRHLTVMLPLLIFPLWFVLKNSWGRYVFTALALFSICYCLIATAVEPRTPYEPANPLTGYYLPLYLQSHLSLNTNGIFSNAFLTQNSVAFNWGKLWGFAGPFQLWPLFLTWILVGALLDKVLGRGRIYLGLSLILGAFLGIIPLCKFLI